VKQGLDLFQCHRQGEGSNREEIIWAYYDKEGWKWKIVQGESVLECGQDTLKQRQKEMVGIGEGILRQNYW